ncbi:hypothetical protein FRC17_005918 [Serendipita sp. 399]|nr:hypothetical protein FRC17_005918 [Serendipita sp. 399]
MPRPRSSTFYLPLAPVDAPLSLKAKLSVLPPSAANALLAPRSTHAQPPQPSAAAAAPTCNPSYVQVHSPSVLVSLLTASGSPSASEDECARLERVLGLSSHVGNRRTARRHTDAPLPQIRADFASNQQPTLPSGSCAPLPPQQQPFEVATTLPPSSPPTPALSQSSSLDSCDSSDGMDMDMDASTFAITDPASSRSLEKPAHHQHIDFTPADNERAPVQRRLSASAPLTRMMVTVEQLSAGHSGLQVRRPSRGPWETEGRC